MNHVKLYTPHTNQRIIHSNTARYRVVVAGRRFGKSALGLNEAIARAALVPRQVIWIILPLYRQAKEIYWIDPDITRYFLPLVHAGVVKADKSELSLHFIKNDSWIRLKGSDNYDSLRGSGLDLIIWDEVADVKQEAFDTIEPALADSPDHRQLYIGTPKGLNWFHDFSLKGNHDKAVPDFGKNIKPHKDWMTWHFSSYDNLTWAEGTKERTSFVNYIDGKRIEAVEKGKLAWFDQEYMASFEEGVGRFFPIWHFMTHTLQESMHSRYGDMVIETMDWGVSNPFAWHAHLIVKENYRGVNFNRVYTFAELYGTSKTPFQWAELIVEKRKQFDISYDSVENIYVDNTMFNVSSDGSISIVKQFNQAFTRIEGHIYNFEKGSKNRKGRWSAMMDWMRIAPDGKPYHIITKDCPNLIRTIPLMEPDPLDIDDMNTKLEDHAVDSVSFGLPYVTWIDAGAIAAIPRGIIVTPHTEINSEKALFNDGINI